MVQHSKEFREWFKTFGREELYPVLDTEISNLRAAKHRFESKP